MGRPDYRAGRPANGLFVTLHRKLREPDSQADRFNAMFNSQSVYPMKTTLSFLAVLLMSISLVAQRPDTLSTKRTANEESNRNVMLNASDDSGPRQISIGLPVVNPSDVIILENDLPVVYHYWPHFPNTHWRADASLDKIGLLKLSEVQTTTGRVGYATNSYSKLGSSTFEGRLNYRLNHFGMQQFDLAFSGPLAKGWLYNVSVYQNFDPGSFDLQFTDFYDRTSIYKGALTKRFGNQRGQISVLYKHAVSRSMMAAANTAPFRYNGDGSITELPGFQLGTTNYSAIDGNMTYRDIVTGELKTIQLEDAAQNRSDEIGLLGHYTFDDGSKLKFSAKYSYSDAAIVFHPGLSITRATTADGYSYSDNGQPYEGYVQNRMSMIDFGQIHDAMMMAEYTRKRGNHNLRIGMNEWFNAIDYQGNSTRFQHAMAPSPRKLDKNGATYSSFNSAGEYYTGTENRTGLYLTDDWNISRKLNLYAGARLEYFTLNGENLPYRRYADFHSGSKNPATGETATPQEFGQSWLLPSFTANLTYRMTRRAGLLAEASYSEQGAKLSDYAGFVSPYTDAVTVPYGRVGVYYNHPLISLVSAVTYIRKTNFQSRFNLVDPSNPAATSMYHLKYDVATAGWTTDAVIKPFEGAELHLLATIQNPQYENYAFEAYGKEYNFNNKQVTGISRILLEIDPSYRPVGNLRLWASFRYFSRQYASISNILFFNPRWETFGGVDYTANRHLTLSALVVNFLNQTGASGSISGSELMTDGSMYNNVYMSGSYLRPLTFELKASVKF